MSLVFRRPRRAIRAIALLSACLMVASNALAAAGLCAFKSPAPARLTSAASTPVTADLQTGVPCPGHAQLEPIAPTDHPLAHPHCTQDQASSEQRAVDPGSALHAIAPPPPLLLWTIPPAPVTRAAAPPATPPPEPAFLRLSRLLL